MKKQQQQQQQQQQTANIPLNKLKVPIWSLWNVRTGFGKRIIVYCNSDF